MRFGVVQTVENRTVNETKTTAVIVN